MAAGSGTTQVFGVDLVVKVFQTITPQLRTQLRPVMLAEAKRLKEEVAKEYFLDDEHKDRPQSIADWYARNTRVRKAAHFRGAMEATVRPIAFELPRVHIQPKEAARVGVAMMKDSLVVGVDPTGGTQMRFRIGFLKALSPHAEFVVGGTSKMIDRDPRKVLDMIKLTNQFYERILRLVNQVVVQSAGGSVKTGPWKG